jgi:acetylornithine aminotransferase
MMEMGMEALFPTYARFPVSFVKGAGSWLTDDQGKTYLDFVSGIAVTNLGHAHPGVKQKLVEQLDELWHTSNLYRIPNQEQFAELLVANSPADHVFFCNSGAEANEAAIKIARRYQRKVAGNDRYEIITFNQSFHGRTLATLTATGQDKVKDGFDPLPTGFVYAPFNDVEAFKTLINEHTAAIMLEMVQGEGGVLPATQAFIDAVKAACDEHGLLLIVDEIQTGVGRTGTLFAFEQYGIEPDVFTLAKGLGNGFPIGAMCGKAKLVEAFNPGTHGSTFGGTPIATAAGIAVLETVLAEDLSTRAQCYGTLLHKKLTDALANNPIVKEVRGLGLMQGIVCTVPVGPMVTAAMEQGLLIVPAGPEVIRLLPNLLVSEEEIDKAVDILKTVLTATAAQTTGSN